jgi:hypothetical protein
VVSSVSRWPTFLVGWARVYRYGVEEALAISAVGMLGVGTLAFMNAGHRASGHTDTIVALVVCAVAAFVVDRRFGSVYAGVAAMICAGVIPFQFDWPDSVGHLAAAAVFLLAFLVARGLHRKHGDDFPGDEYAALEAAACAALYLSLNLRLPQVLGTRLWSSYAEQSGAFYWATYAATWVVPAAALVDAIGAKDRLL